MPYVIKLEEYTDDGTYWIAVFCKKSEIVYFDSFGVEHVPEESIIAKIKYKQEI